ncbi:MAG: prepilin peptidase [Clostridiales bacterium]|nr:prepilin peptidase [Clostridiales bacterium]MCF8021133.1 prepilin peptidase [Clostridiales bacterium]
MMYYIYLLFFVLGLCTGSFLNVCICRMPGGSSVVAPPSSCPHCNTRLGACDLIPVLSYIFLGGKCRYCGSRVSLQYPVIEMLAGMFFVLAAWHFGSTQGALSASVFISFLLAVSVIDLYHHIIPDKIVVFGMVSGILLNFYSIPAVLNGILGFLIGGGILFLVALVSRGGMGGGDIKLAAAAGIYLGWQNTLLMLFLGFLLGSVIGLTIVLLQRKTIKEKIPFGPFLSAAAVISLFWGNILIEWYLALLM